MALGEEERQRYLKIVQQFAPIKRGLEEDIKKLHLQLMERHRELNKLIPVTPNGDRMCETCGVRSMAKEGEPYSAPLQLDVEAEPDYVLMQKYRCEVHSGHVFEEVID